MVAEEDKDYHWYIKIIAGYHYNYSIRRPASHSGMSTSWYFHLSCFLVCQCVYLVLILIFLTRLWE